MTIQQIPTFSDPSYRQTTTLEGVTYILQFDFNMRACAWYLSIADADNVDIYNGVKLTVGFLLLRKCADPRRPPGDFMVLSSTSDLSPPGMLELLPGSGRCTLVYVTSDWLQQIAAGNSQALLDQLDANTQASGSSTYGQT